MTVGLLGLSACADPAPVASMGPIGEPGLITVAPADVGIAIALKGRIADLDPILVQPSTPHLPIDGLVPDGAEVTERQVLIELGRQVLALWIENREVDLAIEESRLAQRKLDASRRRRELEERAEELGAQAAVRQAAIAATRQRDDERIAIAERELAEIERQVADQRKVVAELERLQADGRVSAKQVRQAVRRLQRLELGVEPARISHNIISTTTKSITRFKETVALQKLLLDLGSADGTPDGGIHHRLTVERRKEDASDRESSRRLRKMIQHMERDLPTQKDPAVRAPEAGIIRYGQASLAVGQRFGGGTSLQLVDPVVGSCEVLVPEQLRSLVQAHDPTQPGSGQVRLAVPALGLQELVGVVEAVQTITGEDRRRSRRVHIARIRLATVPEQLPEGVSVAARLLLPIPQAQGRLPIWAIANKRQPMVLLADGTEQSIGGHRFGDQFIITRGLQAGDQVRLPRAVTATSGRRLIGHVEATDAVQVTGRPWRMKFLTMVDDGTPVQQGDVIATLTDRDQSEQADVLVSIGIAEAEADARFIADRLQAELDVAQAAVAWRKAVLDSRLADLEHVLERYSGIDEQVARARAAHGRARLSLETAREGLLDLQAPANQANVTVERIGHSQRDVQRAELAYQRATINLAATLRTRDLRTIARKEAVAERAADSRDAARAAYSRARMEYHSRIARARRQYQRRLVRIDRDREAAEALVMKAPVAGVVYHNPNGWEPLRAGDWLRVRVPFVIPQGDRRRVRLSVPDRLADHYAVGDTVPVRVPALGTEPVTGHIAVVDDALTVSEETIDEILLRGTAGLVPKVFSLVIDLEVPSEAARRLVPGSMAWIEEAE